MKNVSSPLRLRSGFSLVEMIGVLAIIAILAVVIVPKVFSTIASSRITNAVGSINSIKSAVSEFQGKFGSLPVTGGNSRIDDLLATKSPINVSILDSRFAVKIGNQPATTTPGATWNKNAAGAWTATGGSTQGAYSRIICLNSTAAAPSNGNNYLLDGITPLPTGSRVVSAVITGVPIAEARELSLRIDGEPLSTTSINAAAADGNGKVIYNAGTNVNVYVYVTHQ